MSKLRVTKKTARRADVNNCYKRRFNYQVVALAMKALRVQAVSSSIAECALFNIGMVCKYIMQQLHRAVANNKKQ